MIQIWYDSDEVKVFQPRVETALGNALVRCGYDDTAEVVHNPKIPNCSIVPDCGLRLKKTQRYVFIVEVKRTQRDVDSQRYQNQARSYVTDFGEYWEPGYHKYFSITNIEKLILFADRQNTPIVNCILKGNPKMHRVFNPSNKDASLSLSDLEETFCNILPSIFKRNPPEWDNNWEHVTDCFHTNYTSLKNTLPYSEDTNRELSLYELFRLFAYAYLKEYYSGTDSANASYFRNFPPAGYPVKRFENMLSNNYNRIIRLGFKQIFSNHPAPEKRIFPERFTADRLPYFQNLIQCFTQYMHDALSETISPAFVFNLIGSKIYKKEEMHTKGKIMSDTELSNLLATLCIDSPDCVVLDPGCGDGALLDAAYDRLQALANYDPEKTHTRILNQIEGIEIDPFLAQLAAFRLLSKNLSQLNGQTEARILTGDIFQNARPKKYDAVLMNPPFLRNDKREPPITSLRKKKMTDAIKEQRIDCFVSEASQPNLYFYFINFIWNYLNDGGKAGIILMSKFLTNKDCSPLREFIADKVEAILSYPRKYFQDFNVTTSVIILKKGENSPTVSFIRISDENILFNPEEIRSILTKKEDTTKASYKLKRIDRNKLDAKENWNLYLSDPEIDSFFNSPVLTGINYHFEEIARGNAESVGGSQVIYPYKDAVSGNYFGETGKGRNKSRINIPAGLNKFIGYGIQNNRIKRNYILQLSDLEYEKAFHFPIKDDTASYSIFDTVSHSEREDLNRFYGICRSYFGAVQWKKIINSARKHTYSPKIIIPRTDRTKHRIYFNPLEDTFTLSSNFWYCNKLQNSNSQSTDKEQYKFVTAFLLSAFGQIQFELNAGNQEGARKIEGFMILNLKIPDLTQLSPDEITSVVSEFDALNLANPEFNGEEGISTPRRALDTAIGKILYARNLLSFSSVEKMVDYFELYLADLVEERKI